jgi:uncharacterized membrane protein
MPSPRVVSGVVALGILLTGCTRDPEAPPGASLDLHVPEAGSAAEVLPTESSLAIKRGIITIAEDGSAAFHACGAKEASQATLWVLDQSPEGLAQTLLDEQQATPVSLYVEAYGERAPADEVPAAQDFAGVFVLEEILYARVPEDLRSCEAADPTYVVLARGNEPFWSVEVHEAHAIWREPETPDGLRFAAPEAINAEGAVRYSARGNGHELELMVHAQPCRDSMSGEYFAYSAKAILDGREVNGCARVGR